MLRHVRGQYFVRIKGVTHYLGTDQAVAQQDYERLIAHAWSPRRVDRSHSDMTISDVAERMLEDYDATHAVTVTGRLPSAYWRHHLKRFRLLFDPCSLSELATPAPEMGRFQPPVINYAIALGKDLRAQGLSPRTVRHDLFAIRRLFAFAADHGWCAPISFRAVKPPMVARTVPRVLPRHRIESLLARAHKLKPQLMDWMAINYLACLRPSEVVSLVHAYHETGLASGRFVEAYDERSRTTVRDTVYEIDQHKTLHKSLTPRLVVLVPQALECLERSVPVWSRLDSYAQAIRLRGLNDELHGPKVLQKSAASHLRAAGGTADDIQYALGHAMPSVYTSYVHTPYLRLAQQMQDVLTLDLP